MFISTPIWLTLFHRVLEVVNASELMWFLYWIYVPSVFFAGICNALGRGDE